MAGLNVVSFRPERSDYAWTFGGVDPVMKVKPGDVLEVWTDDCFAGLVESVDDLPSKKITAFNPQTGPFFVEGAEPGDTLALHFVSIEPSRDWAVSTTFPLFGALTSTTRTVTLQEPLPELVWRYDVDRERRIVHFEARTATSRPTSRSIRCTGPWGWPPLAVRPVRRWCPTRTAATWTRPRCARGRPATSA